MARIQDAIDAAVDWLSFLPDPIVVMLLAFNPIGEVRFAVPVAMLVYGMGWGEAAVWALIGNLAVGPVAGWAVPAAERLIRKSARGNRLMDRMHERTHHKQKAAVTKWKAAAIALFIAIPLPGSGAWTAVVVAHIFGIGWRDAWRYFYAGVVAATALVVVLVQFGWVAWN